jgi:hypothetical protein
MAVACYEAVARLGQNPHEEHTIYRENPMHSWSRRTPLESQPKPTRNREESDQNEKGIKSSRWFVTNIALD